MRSSELNTHYERTHRAWGCVFAVERLCGHIVNIARSIRRVRQNDCGLHVRVTHHNVHTQRSGVQREALRHFQSDAGRARFRQSMDLLGQLEEIVGPQCLNLRHQLRVRQQERRHQREYSQRSLTVSQIIAPCALERLRRRKSDWRSAHL